MIIRPYYIPYWFSYRSYYPPDHLIVIDYLTISELMGSNALLLNPDEIRLVQVWHRGRCLVLGWWLAPLIRSAKENHGMIHIMRNDDRPDLTSLLLVIKIYNGAQNNGGQTGQIAILHGETDKPWDLETVQSNPTAGLTRI